MELSVITIGQVQNVLSAMQKNLECPICLDVVQEPVSTKCDHIFCRFCMFKLLNKKKKGVVECPLCKTEVTKRSLKENSRFKQLIEGLLETIHAFELDTGVKFLKSHHFAKTSTEATAAESLCKESSVIQSKGFRNRRKSARGNGQENFTLQEASVNIQLADAKMCHPKNKAQKSGSQKGTYIEFGSESSEEFFKEASKTGFEDKGAVQISSQVRLEELESAEKGNENSCNAQPDKLCAKEMALPDIIGEGDFLKECLSKRSTQSITECANPDQVNVTECQSSPLSVLAVDLPPEPCDRAGDASPTLDGDTSFFKNPEEMEEQQTQHNSENQEFGLEDSSESRLDKSREMDTDVQSVEAVEGYEPENDSSHDKELPLEELPQPETLHSATLNKVSKKRLKQSIQKVNEWFSKSNEILSSGSSVDESAASADVSGEGDLCLSDKESCISAKTDPLADSMEIAAVERKKRWSNQKAEDIKDKIFGKTYKRERKSNPPSTLRDILPTRQKEDVAAAKCLTDVSKDRLKRKRKTACVLQPEDFIKKKDTEKADGGPQSVSGGLGDAEKKRCDESVAANESHLSQNRANNTLTEAEEGGESTWKKAAEKITTKHCDGEPEMYNCDQKCTKKRSSAAKRCRHSSRTMCALELVVDRGSVFPDPAEPQIDSYPSSGEPRKDDSEQNPVRRSRRLQLLSEEMTKETRKGVKGARNNSDHGRSVSGDQRNVATHSAECKDLCEPQGEASGSDSEISIVEDSCGPFSQGEILTTQQKNAMQNSLKKLQQEMAALEAVLEQNGSQNCEVLPVYRELPHSSTEGASERDQMSKEINRSPELLLSSSKSSLKKRPDLEKGPECDSVLQTKTPSEKTKPVQEAVQEHRQCQLEAENTEEQKSGSRQNSASVSSDLFGNVTQTPDNSPSSVRLFTPQTAEAPAGPVMAQNTDKSCGPGHKLKRSESFPVPVLHNATGKENTTNPGVTKRKEMSVVVSGLNHSEHLVVQKFVKKTQSTLSNHITEGTTHVIMKTDEELVCERTLKYFLGIAGGKWVVSYQWIIQSFKAGRILDEENFEVRGDVINGRNHQGPKRARQALTEKIFKDFEICCCGPFTDMTTEHLEWLVELCGASVVKQPDLFTPTANSTAVVVVQPDAWKENVDCRAIQQHSKVAVVTREWVLDSVACYQCQELRAYLVS
ncbi:breast cancer type 1 susceptibility protein isoform X4 [Pyrgilauda ruficollis]|uniref:breast cancer type 1 susceptibility protein isoform X4 n=1 Tax=Pyrgilauda ruficollis TaxID=221976 RepID=UPI001B86246D|nr:breast cancer type 1 susceptibility protein isoform X4 [Pyrgilauda ruficollis]